MDCDGWLSTRNKKKVQQLQHRVQKRRSSTLKSVKTNCLQMSHSPPPKQLFTATKQSSLNDFFSAGGDHHLEVEVNLDDDAEEINHNQKQSVCETTELSAYTYQNNGQESMSVRDRGIEHRNRADLRGKEKDSFCCNAEAFRRQTNIRDIETELENSPTDVKSSTAVTRKIVNNRIDIETEELEGSDGEVDIKPTKVKRKSRELDNNLSPCAKRKKSNKMMAQIKLNMIENADWIHDVKTCENSEKDDEIREGTAGQPLRSDRNIDSVSEISQDIRLPMSCFSSQSLQLDSQVSLDNLQTEFDGAFTLTLETQSVPLQKQKEFENTDLELHVHTSSFGNVKEDVGTESEGQDLLTSSLTFSSQDEAVGPLSNGITFTPGSLNGTSSRKYEDPLSSESLDLSSQKDSFDLSKETRGDDTLADELGEDSQLSFELSPLEQVHNDGSLQLH